MAYTVKQLAKLSGVTVRTLHWYDEIGLLKPAYLGSNGYRYYEEEQLLILQQILFFRELGFGCKQIQKVIGRSDFDKIVALKSHRGVLQNNVERTQKLIKTIDKTIQHLQGDKKMNEQEMYDGFDPKKQKEYEKQLVDRFGEKVKEHFKECEKNVKNWDNTDWDNSRKGFDEICSGLAKLMESGSHFESTEVQKLIRKHYQWLKRFWIPTKESYLEHGRLIAETNLAKPYRKHHPEMPEFIAEGIRVFAEAELS